MTFPTSAPQTAASPPQWRRVPDGAECEFWSERPEFNGGEVQIWHVDLSRGRCDEDMAMLSEDERARAGRLYFERDRSRFVTCRAALRRLLGECLRAAPESLRFERGPHGKPLLIHPRQMQRLTFNVSHSQQSALLAVSRYRQVGVDIEFVRDNLDPLALAERFFTSAEADFIRRRSPLERSRAFFEVWVLKEAWLKAAGVGLSGNLREFDVSAYLSAPPAPAEKDWALMQLPPPPHSSCIAALATPVPQPRVFLWLA